MLERRSRSREIEQLHSQGHCGLAAPSGRTGTEIPVPHFCARARGPPLGCHSLSLCDELSGRARAAKSQRGGR